VGALVARTWRRWTLAQPPLRAVQGVVWPSSSYCSTPYAACCPPAARVLSHLEQPELSPQNSLPTLRADPPSEQQVHSRVFLRRAVDAV
jgi:hypothetical protein